jgi:hypothetical protein
VKQGSLALGDDLGMGAEFSDCGTYRYALWRTWNALQPGVLFVGLNPSTADATTDDPTIRRCIGFAKRWGYGGITMANVFAYRATDPREMTVLAPSARSGRRTTRTSRRSPSRPASSSRPGEQMAQTTAIEWTDLSWNPTHGCSKVSPGCAHCYAETLSRRLQADAEAVDAGERRRERHPEAAQAARAAERGEGLAGARRRGRARARPTASSSSSTRCRTCSTSRSRTSTSPRSSRSWPGASGTRSRC